MNYQKIYNGLVEKAKVRGLDKSKHEGYFEIHHIVPRCLGGSNDESNLVMLNLREHLIAHLLLWKAYPDNYKLVYAARMMSTKNGMRLNSRLYESIKIDFLKNPDCVIGKPNRKDLTGQSFERLSVIQYSHTGGKGRSAYWDCLCSCGKELKIQGSSLLNGNSKSCGCLRDELSKSRTGVKPHMLGPRNLTKEQKEELKSRHIRAGIDRPWKTSASLKEGILEKWSLADYYYSLWLFFDKPGVRKFSVCFNTTHNDNLKPSYFQRMYKMFTNGWIPSEDEEWVKFSEGG